MRILYIFSRAVGKRIYSFSMPYLIIIINIYYLINK
jgi:hypothetical protein